MGEPKCASRDEGRGCGDGGTDHIVVLASQASGERVDTAPALITALLAFTRDRLRAKTCPYLVQFHAR